MYRFFLWFWWQIHLSIYYQYRACLFGLKTNKKWTIGAAERNKISVDLCMVRVTQCLSAYWTCECMNDMRVWITRSHRKAFILSNWYALSLSLSPVIASVATNVGTLSVYEYIPHMTDLTYSFQHIQRHMFMCRMPFYTRSKTIFVLTCEHTRRQLTLL